MITNILEKWCRDNSIPISAAQLGAFEKYASLLKSWNEKMNLTAITEEYEIAVKHFIDSISVLGCFEIQNGAKLIDIGTGAGFPGIPIGIMRQDINITLLDSLNKRLIFLNEVCDRIGVKAQIIHARAEEYGQKPEYREKYDIAISRAVANLPALCEYCMPYVRTGGHFISMKGPEGEKELTQAAKAIEVLGGELSEIRALTLPDGSTRTVIIIKKVKSTPNKYPRRGVKITKSPLM